MAKEKGQTGWRIYIATDTGLIPTEISNTLNLNNSIIDASDKGSGGNTENIDGRFDWSTDFELNYDPEDAVSMAIIDKIIDPATDTETDIIIGKQTAAGDIGFSGKARIASVSISGADQDLITMSGSMTGNGGLTKLPKE